MAKEIRLRFPQPITQPDLVGGVVEDSYGVVDGIAAGFLTLVDAGGARKRSVRITGARLSEATVEAIKQDLAAHAKAAGVELLGDIPELDAAVRDGAIEAKLAPSERG